MVGEHYIFNGPFPNVEDFTITKNIGRFTSIDRVRIVNRGADYGSNFNVAFDDIRIRYAGTPGDGDRIDVPDGTNIAALVASAASDGHGGTLLKYQGGQLDLEGVAAGSVSAAWFV